VAAHDSSREKCAIKPGDHDYEEHAENRTKAKQRTKDNRTTTSKQKCLPKFEDVYLGFKGVDISQGIQDMTTTGYVTSNMMTHNVVSLK
jgi:hypothetical protein